MNRPHDLAAWPLEPSAGTSNLPVKLTSFLGREREVRQLTSLLGGVAWSR
jgi:hypothetical protein